MCYTGKCMWENHWGDCTYPSSILGATHKCNCNMQEYIDTKKQVIKYRLVQERNKKIKIIKNKLLDKTI